MTRRQIQFESDSDREREIERHFAIQCLKLFGVIVLAVVLLVLIGLASLHGKQVDHAGEHLGRSLMEKI